MGRIARLVLRQQRKEGVEIGRHFGDDGAVDLGEEAGEQRGLTAAPSEQLDDPDPLVALDGGAQRVDRFDRTADGGREADAIIGAENVVVHRLGHRDHRHALRGEMGGEAQGAVAAERDHRVDAEPLQHFEHVTRRVGAAGGARVGAGGVKDGPAHAVQPANPLAAELQRVGVNCGVIPRVDREHAFPAAAEADHLPVQIVGGEGDGADAGVEARHVAAAGEDTYPHGLLLLGARL
jgi:hypothetical protein